MSSRRNTHLYLVTRDQSERTPAVEPTEWSSKEFVRRLSDRRVFAHLVDHLPDCLEKDLLRCWGYLYGIYPHLPGDDAAPPESPRT